MLSNMNGKKDENESKMGISQFFQKRKPSKPSSIGTNEQSSTVATTTVAKEIKYPPGEDDSMSYGRLCKVYSEIEETSKRLEINDLLVTFLTPLMEPERNNDRLIVSIIHLSLGRLGPAYDSPELGLGEHLLMKAISLSSGLSMEHLKKQMELLGDLGLLAQESKGRQKVLFKPKPLTITSLERGLREIALISGKDSSQKKVDRVQGLYVACETPSEAKFLFRLLEGKLRIGLAEQSILAALANGSAIHYPERPSFIQSDDPITILKSVYNSLPDYRMIIPPLLHSGPWTLQKECQLTPGIPLKPMLAYPTKSISEVLDRFSCLPFTCEWKYDGERAQIHRLKDGSLKIYSRNSEDMTSKYPDVLRRMASLQTCTSYVIDSEVVAFSVKDAKILPFQVLSTRKRKDVEEGDIEVQVCIFVFDLLYFDGRSLVEEDFFTRRSLLHSNFKEVEGSFMYAKYRNSVGGFGGDFGGDVDNCGRNGGNNNDDNSGSGIGSDAQKDSNSNVASDSNSTKENSSSPEELIQQWLEESIEEGCEGLMVKTLKEESSYEPSKRSRKWLKVKKDYLDGLGDSLDLVVIGGYIGKGRRTGTYGGYLLACWDGEQEAYQAICKIGTGFKDDDLERQFLELKKLEIPSPKPYYHVSDGVKPDVWFEPRQVWEIRAADLSISPIYTAAWGHVEAGKGISLRFPRFIRWRDDKGGEEATTSSQISQMYSSQALMNGGAGGGGAFEDDYY